MSDLSDVVLLGAILPRLCVSTRRQAIQALSEGLAGAAQFDPAAIFDKVLRRERLAGTGVGEGVAIPHAVIEGLPAPVGGFARLDPPIDFKALDGRAADLVFILLAPGGGAHLKSLARISRFFRRADTREKLRAARSRDELWAVFAAGVRSDAA